MQCCGAGIIDDEHTKTASFPVPAALHSHYY